eukprot:sb/3471851/
MLRPYREFDADKQWQKSCNEVMAIYRMTTLLSMGCKIKTMHVNHIVSNTYNSRIKESNSRPKQVKLRNSKCMKVRKLLAIGFLFVRIANVCSDPYLQISFNVTPSIQSNLLNGGERQREKDREKDREREGERERGDKDRAVQLKQLYCSKCCIYFPPPHPDLYVVLLWSLNSLVLM